MKKNILIILFLYLCGYLIIHSLYKNNFYSIEYIYDFSLENTILALILFSLLFIFGMVMLLPIAMIFLFTSGIIWGVTYGTIISTVCTSIAASISFLVMRNFSNTNLVCKLKEKINNRLKLDMNVNDQIR